MENNDHYYQLPGESKPKRTMKIVALCALVLFGSSAILMYALNGDDKQVEPEPMKPVEDASDGNQDADPQVEDNTVKTGDNSTAPQIQQQVDSYDFPVLDAELRKTPLYTTNVDKAVKKDSAKAWFDRAVKTWKKFPKLSVEYIMENSEFKLEESPDELANSTVVIDTLLVGGSHLRRDRPSAYTGLVSESGKMHGVGRTVDIYGNIYEAQLQNGIFHGFARKCPGNSFDGLAIIIQYNKGELVSWKHCMNGKNIKQGPYNKSRDVDENDPQCALAGTASE